MITIERREKIDVITFSVNRINALITDDLREQIGKVFEVAGSKAIIDLTGVHYIDSSGFGCFLSILKTARNNYGVLKFAHPEPAIMELFKTLHLHTVFQIYDDLESCISSFK
ncbi:MAG TPA: STAS domain-containing protein [Bacteroidales bacterium]|nr:STAS domain-containing protein [Bacteroidales bacterium]